MGGARCATHGLAVAPDGRCVVCRREAAPAPAPEPSAAPSASRHAGAVAAWVGATLVAAVVVAAEVGTLGGLVPSLVSETLPGTAPRGAPGPAMQPKPASKAKPIDPSVLKFVSETFAPGSQPEPAAPAPPPTAPLGTPPAAVDEARAAREAEERRRDLERKATIEKDWEDRARVRARGGVSVTMYSAAWCGVCTRARAYMDEARIAYVERDVEANPAYAARARALNPRGSVPTFDIDGATMVGFSPSGLEQAIERAAKAGMQR